MVLFCLLGSLRSQLDEFSLQGQFRGRPEIAPDQREKFLQRLQQVQQQGHSNLLSGPHLSGASHKQFTTQQQNSLLQQVILSFSNVKKCNAVFPSHEKVFGSTICKLFSMLLLLLYAFVLLMKDYF